MAYSTEDEIREMLWRQRNSPGRQGGQDFGETPAEGSDAQFDEKVRLVLAQKQMLREECWLAFGGTGEPAKVGEIPDFDARVDNAFQTMRARGREQKLREEADFERAVANEMKNLMSDVKAEMREQDRKAQYDARGADRAFDQRSRPDGFFGADRSDSSGFFGGQNDSRPDSGSSYGAGPQGQQSGRPNASSRRFTAQRTASSIVFG